MSHWPGLERYITNENRAMTISVNNEVVDMPTVNSGSWTTSASINVPITLEKGDNIISISNASAYAPDIDCITLVKK